MKCSILACGVSYSRNRPNLTFHRIPKNELKRRKWLEALGKENLKPNLKVIFICSLHFVDSDFNKTLDVVRLKDEAVPSIIPKKDVTKSDSDASHSETEDETGLEEEEIWANVDYFPPCADCGGASDKDGKLFQCVECPRVVCAECERADRHRQHCMLRLPSRRIYDKLRTVFEAIREAVTAHLVVDDGEPILELKTEPIEADPLNTTITEEAIQDPIEVKAVASKPLIVRVRNLPATVPLPKSMPSTISVPEPKCVLSPETLPLPKSISTTETVPEPIRLQQVTYPLPKRLKKIILKPKSVTLPKSIPTMKSVPEVKCVLSPKTVPLPKSMPSTISVPEAKCVLSPKTVPLPKSMPSTISVPEAKCVLSPKTVPLPKPMPSTISVPEVKCVLSPKTVPLPKSMPSTISVPEEKCVLSPKTVPLPKTVPSPKTVPKSVLEANTVPKPIFDTLLVTEPKTHIHTYTHRKVYTRVKDTFPVRSELTTASTECDGTAKRKKSNSNDEVVIFTHMPKTSKETSKPRRLEGIEKEDFDS